MSEYPSNYEELLNEFIFLKFHSTQADKLIVRLAARIKELEQELNKFKL